MSTKRFKHITALIFDTRIAIWIICALLLVPNAALCVTEHMAIVPAVANLILPLGVWLLLLACSANIGRSVVLFLPLMFLNAFQIVLLFLYHNSIIAVDMFLNVATTNPGEAGELLDRLLHSIVTVLVLYIPLIIWGIVSWLKGLRTPSHTRRTMARTGLACTITGIVTVWSACANVPEYTVADDLYPVNVCRNLGIAIKRIENTKNYLESSAEFRFNATSVHPDSLREVYIMVIGETTRADNMQLLGYPQPTTPRLNSTQGVLGARHALTESNTTHKSVPMLLSTVRSENFDTIYHSKSIITAFKEAGFHTTFLSAQKRNRSFIDYFGEEADSVCFLTDNNEQCIYDSALAQKAVKLIRPEIRKQFIVIHSYGSHFCYTDRYPATEAIFLPDDFTEASPAARHKLINAYDNTVTGVDRMLSELIDTLQADSTAVSALLYASDHGEDIFDDHRQRFLHASPTPTYWQLHVPMIAWLSDSYENTYQQEASAMAANMSRQISTSRSMAPTMLQIAGIDYPAFEPEISLASLEYTEPQRVYLNDHNLCVSLRRAGLTALDFNILSDHGISTGMDDQQAPSPWWFILP